MAISPLTGRRVMIDPGHGGKFSGAVGPTGVQEKDVTLAIARRLENDLVDLGMEVRMTRSEDVHLAETLRDDLKARVDLANNWPAELFISIHANSNDSPAANGTETYHSRQASNRSKTVAKLVQKSMIEDVQLRDRGVKASDFYVIKNTTMPAILVETAFVSNPAEEAKLNDPVVQAQFAAAIAKGVGDFFTIEPHLKPDMVYGPKDKEPEPGFDNHEYWLAPGDPVEMLLAHK